MRSSLVFISAIASAQQEAATEVYEVHASPNDRHPGSTLAVVELDARADEQTSVAEVVEELPGLQLRTLGGLGAMSAVSVRGSSPAQVGVYLDGVPLNRGALGSVDLGQFSLESLERIEVWSGLPPVDRMGAGLGGAIDLVPRRASGGELRGMIGSFGSRGGFVRAGDRRGQYFYSAAASYLGAEGDFSYLNHQGTLLDASDDVISTRGNNGFDQTAGTAVVTRSDWIEARLLEDVFYRTQGIAGPLTVETRGTGLDIWRSVTHLRVGRPGQIESAAYVTLEQNHYRDPENELGVGAQDQRGRTLAAGGELRAIWTAGPTVLTVVPQVHHERYRQQDALAEEDLGDLRAERLVLGGGISDVIALWHDRWLLEPALRVDRYVDTLAGDAERQSWLMSPRLGSRLTVTQGWDLHASGGRYHRAPTFIEMFGDRGYAVGNSELAPETGLAADVGVSWYGLSWIRVQATFHWAEVEDLILFVQNSQQTLRAENIGRARLVGSEFALTAGPTRHLRVTANYTFLSPQDLVQEGNELPGRARHEAYARGDTGPWPLGPLRASVFADAEVVAGMFFDQANFRPMPRRIFVGGGLKLQLRRWSEFSLTVEGKNLLDAKTETVEINPGGYRATVALQDYVGYALPGRAVYAMARVVF